MANQESKLNTTPLKATAASDKQKFLQSGTIEHIDVTKQPGIVPIVPVSDPDVPAVIPAEACYLGWQESLILLAKLVEAEIPDQE